MKARSLAIENLQTSYFNLVFIMDHRNRVSIRNNKIKTEKLQTNSLHFLKGFIDFLCYSTSGRTELITDAS